MSRAHQKFIDHIISGGKVYRNDPLNDVKEWLDLSKLDNDANNITQFGYMDLTRDIDSIPDEVKVLLDKLDSSLSNTHIHTDTSINIIKNYLSKWDKEISKIDKKLRQLRRVGKYDPDFIYSGFVIYLQKAKNEFLEDAKDYDHVCMITASDLRSQAEDIQNYLKSS